MVHAVAIVQLDALRNVILLALLHVNIVVRLLAFILVLKTVEDAVIYAILV